MKQTLLLFTLCFYLSGSAQVPTSGLHALYDFSGGSLEDVTANNNDFTQTGTALTSVNDRFNETGNAISLNGDYLTRADLDYPNSGNDIDLGTISFWIKTTTNDSDIKTILDDTNGRSDATSDNTWAGYYFYLLDGKVGVSARVEYSSTTFGYQGIGVIGNDIISDGQWHHIVASMKGTLVFTGSTDIVSATISLYVDGVSQGSAGVQESASFFAGGLSFNQTMDAAGNITIGNNRSNNLPDVNRYQDEIDDIIFYTRQLTVAEILEVATDDNFCFPDETDISISNIEETSLDIELPTDATFDIAYHKESESFGMATIITDISDGIETINSLPPSTPYLIYVREHCTASLRSAWSTSVRSRTGGLIYVDIDATGGNDGSSWSDAYTDLQDALADAVEDAQIWIAEGIYSPGSARSDYFDFDMDDLSVYGGFDGTETALSERSIAVNTTILSADVNGDDTGVDFTANNRSENNYHVGKISADRVTLDGLQFNDAQADGSSNDATGGGILLRDQISGVSALSPTIRNCEFNNNVSNAGGAGILIRIETGNSTVTIENCVFNNNLSTYGTGLYLLLDRNYIVNLNVTNSLFTNNTSKDNALGQQGFTGSSIWSRTNWQSSTLNTNITNCTFSGNSDIGNRSDSEKGTLAFSKVVTYASTAVLNANIYNSIVYDNTDIIANATPSINRGHETAANNINVANSISEDSFTNATSTTGISASDPLFTDASNDDFTLQASSPAIDAGDNSLVNDFLTDIIGNVRVHNSTVDLGPYEFGSSPPIFYTLALSATNGSIMVDEDPIQGKYLSGKVLELTANPDLGYRFDGWSGDASGSDNPLSLSMDSDKTISASFVSLITDEAVIIASASSCTGESTTVTLAGSSSGVNYTLRNSADDSVIDGPIEGDGNPIEFTTGTITGSTTFNVYAELIPDPNYALDLQEGNQYVAAGEDTDFDYDDGYTFEAWVNSSFPTSSSHALLGIGTASFSDIEIYIQGTTGLLTVVHNRTSSPATYYQYPAPPKNEWAHIAVTYDGGTSGINVYYDGVSQTESFSLNPTGTALKRTGATLNIGKVPIFNSSSDTFLGQIDEVRLWSDARTEAEILSDMSESLSGTENGLVSYFNFDEGTGSTAQDLAGGNDGTLTNMDSETDWVAGAIESRTIGQEMSTEVTVTAEDILAPSINAQNISIEIDENSGNATLDANLLDNGTTDNCTTAEDITFFVDQTTFTCSDIGENTVTLTAEDQQGNQSTAQVTVTVVDVTAPTLVTQDLTVQLDATGNVTVTANTIDNGSSDNCTSDENLTFSLDKSSFTCSDLGQNTVQVTVEDESGNQTSSSAIITVEDNISPTATARDITVALDVDGNAEVSPSSIDNGSTDNCTSSGDLTFSLDIAAFDCEDIGTNSVVLTVADASGNQSTADATITIVDQTAPNVITQNVSVFLDSEGNASITASGINNGSFDNCTADASLVMSLDITSFTVSDLGENTVTLTVEDAAGNRASETAIVTVSDKELQTITFNSIPDKVYGDASFDLSASSNAGLPVSFSLLSGPASLSGSTLSITGAGEVTVEATQAGDDTYASASEQQSFTIAKAQLTVTADDKVITYGAAIPELTATYQGFVNGEGTEVLSAIPGMSTNATESSDAGSYDIILTGGGSDNYAFDLVNGVLTIEKANQQITVDPIEDKLISDAPFTVAAATTSGLVLSYAVTGPAAIAGNEITLDGIEGTVTVTVSQAGNINYNETSSSISFEVIDPNQVITFDEIADKTYGDGPFGLVASVNTELPLVFNVVSGPASLSENTVTLTGSGEVTIEVTQAGDGVYLPASQQQSFMVNKASLLVIADDKTMTFGEELPALTYTYDGFVNGENETALSALPTATISGEFEGAVPAGTYPINVSGGTADNYAFQYTSATLTVNKADQVITLEPITDKKSDDAPFDVVASVDSGLELTFDISGPATIEGTTVTLTGEGGEVVVTASQAGNENYNAAITSESFTVANVLNVEDLVSELVIYPNPVSDFIRINEDKGKVESVSIRDLNGRELIKSDKNQVDVTKLSIGAYLIEVTVNKKKKVIRFIKK